MPSWKEPWGCPVSEQPIYLALAEAVREVLEKMFFIDIMDPDACQMAPGGVAAEVVFDGDPPGSFHLELDITAARSAAADFLGEDPDELTGAQMEEVVCELANMICGAALSRIESTATFRLSKPEIAGSAGPPATAPTAAFEAAAGGGMLRAEIRMERPVCPEIGESEF